MILAPTLTLSAGSGAAIVRPSFSRDFAGEKTLNNGTGPAITFTRASDATYFDADGVLQTATNDTPRFDHDPSTGASRGLLIEESRTNSIRNSQAGGAATGTPGTLPINWAVASSGTGITREIVDTGTAGGFSYVDIRWSGTATSTVLQTIRSEGLSHIVASDGQSWTSSLYASVVGGSTSDVSNLLVYILERDSTSAVLASSTTDFASTVDSSVRRFSVTRTLNNASAAFVSQAVGIGVANGNTIDITLRIAAPQLEQGAFPTSYIPTTSAAATRAADSAVVTPISSFYNQAEGTLFAEGSSVDNIAGTTARRFLQFDDDSTDNRVAIEFRLTNQSRLQVSDGGVTQATLTGGGTMGQNSKIIGAYRSDDFRFAANGTLSAADTSGTVPVNTHLRLGANPTNSPAASVNGHIRKIAYYPRRLSDQLLQQLTT